MAPTLDDVTLDHETKCRAMRKLLARMEPEPNSGCWLSIGSLNWNGYTLIHTWLLGRGRGRTFTAHRLTYELFRGEIPCGALVLHRCNVKICVNPEHLYLGSKRDNAIDISRLGRPGSRALRLDATSVREIRRLLALGIPRREIRRRFGIAKPTLKDVVRGRTWAWVP